MAVSDGYLDFVLDSLGSVGGVSARRMFGGAGLYLGDLFFGLIADDVLYFKVDDGNRGKYERAGMPPFRPYGTYAMSYRQVPAEVLDDASELRAWAVEALDAARRSGERNKRKKARSGGRNSG